ncbi:hypothetical protein E4U23_005714 [Claviceps purpurea]|nr:hypothetical protein E4U11_006867 [Claviceps purpurea]KAG6254719.1 hypothetical protein E4U23_005714 [Claviceps purpurea]
MDAGSPGRDLRTWMGHVHGDSKHKQASDTKHYHAPPRIVAKPRITSSFALPRTTLHYPSGISQDSGRSSQLSPYARQVPADKTTHREAFQHADPSPLGDLATWTARPPRRIPIWDVRAKSWSSDRVVIVKLCSTSYVHAKPMRHAPSTRNWSEVMQPC